MVDAPTRCHNMMIGSDYQRSGLQRVARLLSGAGSVDAQELATRE